LPHVALVPITVFRVRDREMQGLGMALPGPKARAGAIAPLPALGLLTLAGLNPPEWDASDLGSGGDDAERLADLLPRLSRGPEMAKALMCNGPSMLGDESPGTDGGRAAVEALHELARLADDEAEPGTGVVIPEDGSINQD
jgi:hypothetical protein